MLSYRWFGEKIYPLPALGELSQNQIPKFPSREISTHNVNLDDFQIHDQIPKIMMEEELEHLICSVAMGQLSIGIFPDLDPHFAIDIETTFQIQWDESIPSNCNANIIVDDDVYEKERITSSVVLSI